ARVLTLCAERLMAAGVPGQSPALDSTRKVVVLDLAVARARDSLDHTLTPDSNYLMLAYLAYLKGDGDRLRFYAGEALKRDPHFPNAHWLMAEGQLANDDFESAAREAQLALEIKPSLRQAKSALARARGERGDPPTTEQAIERARFYINDGNQAKAERVLRRAIARSDGSCAECSCLL